MSGKSVNNTPTDKHEALLVLLFYFHFKAVTTYKKITFLTSLYLLGFDSDNVPCGYIKTGLMLI